MCAKLLQSCPTLHDPMDCSPPGSSIHGILQARTLERLAMSSSRGCSWPRDLIPVSGFITTIATWEAHISICEWEKVSQSCLTICDPMDYTVQWNSPGCNTRVGCCSLLQGISQPRDWTQVSSIAGRLFTSWTSHISTYRLANPQSINKCQWGFSCVSESCTLQLDSGFKFPMPSGPGEQIRKWKQKPKSVVWKLIVQINARLQHNLQTAACE